MNTSEPGTESLPSFSRRTALRAVAAGAAGVAVAGSAAGCAAGRAVAGQTAAAGYDARKLVAFEEAWSHPSALDLNPPADSAPGNLINTVITPALLDVDRRLSLMDRAGIEKMVLSMTTPGIQGEPDPVAAVRRARQLNDALAEVVRAHPGRFWGFAAVPLQNPRAAADELERCVTQLGFVGALYNGFSNVGNQLVYSDGPAYDVWWDRVDGITRDRSGNFAVYLHPRESSLDLPFYRGVPQIRGSVWNYNVEAATHFQRLLVTGVFDRHPHVQIVLGHLGEGVPWWVWREDHKMFGRNRAANLKQHIPYYLTTNAYYTTSGFFDDTALEFLIRVVGLDRVMFSVDYPYESITDACGWMNKLPLAATDKAKLGYRTATRLFGLG
jgi:predicted TIM-barrel fold metal-dependent hydrolase